LVYSHLISLGGGGAGGGWGGLVFSIYKVHISINILDNERLENQDFSRCCVRCFDKLQVQGHVLFVACTLTLCCNNFERMT
jgi:hypothetical protein